MSHARTLSYLLIAFMGKLADCQTDDERLGFTELFVSAVDGGSFDDCVILPETIRALRDADEDPIAFHRHAIIVAVADAVAKSEGEDLISVMRAIDARGEALRN